MTMSQAPIEAVGQASTAIPLTYRMFFLFIEPISALVGAYFSFFQPQTYLELTHAASAPLTGIPLTTQVVLQQLSNLYLLFAINEALVLRSTSDLRVWRTLLCGLLVADFGHLYSVNGLGSHVYWNASLWTAMDWGNVGFVYFGAVMRTAFLLGIGLPGENTGAKGVASSQGAKKQH
ncbi:MAG: hypothetical protein LQ347_003409 [Umbilicaria vellea]|nr:MAG: hypothetical protein LQ347_003409 [Umbilicaria vellea]